SSDALAPCLAVPQSPLPSYKQRMEEFKRLFKELPDSEMLILDYPCALQRDILLQGRLYLSENWICFYSNVFRSTKVTRRISVPEPGRSAQRRGVMSSDRMSLATPRLCSKVQVSYWTDASQSVSPSIPHSLLTSMLTRTCRSKVARKALKKVEQASKDASHFSLLSFLFIMLLSFLPPPVEDRIGRSEELGRLFVNRVFHISANKMFELLFTESSFTRRFMDIRRISNPSFTAWEKDDSGNEKRILNYAVTINNPLIGKFSTATENQVRFCPEGQHYRVDAEVYTHDVPYHDYFYIQNRYYIIRISKRKCRLR
ncbi:hypothetical protein GOODEAATRI_025715, partial [Goodea atripinnis]